MQQRIVTVFGGSGFLGRHLVGRLAKAGHEVRAAVRDVEAANFLRVLGDVGQVVPWPADVTEPDRVAAALKDATDAVNLVGILYERGKSTFQRVHVEGAANVARAAKAAGVGRLAHVSAIGADANSAARYARTKAAGEAAVRAAFPGAVILRPSVVFGPEDNFFNMFAGLARLTPVLPVFGCPVLPKVRLFPEGGFLSVDLYGAVQKALAEPATAGKTYELGGPVVYSFKELMDLLLAETGRKRFLMPLPFALATLQAWFLEKMPKPLLTRDQVELMKRDNVVAPGALGFAALGIKPKSAEAILPTYLHRFRTPARQGHEAA